MVLSHSSDVKHSDAQSFVVGIEHHDMRVDKVLSAMHADLSRARVQALITQGQVTLNGQICLKASEKVSEDDKIAVIVPPPVAAEPMSENIALDIIYEDDDLIVLNKQAGLVVHPGAGNHTGTLVNALLYHCGDNLSGIGGVMRPGIVHRLDKDTTGLMVVAKTDRAHQGLSVQLADRSLSRKYKALVLGDLMPPKGVVDQPIGRHASNRLKMDVNERNGKAARTHYRVLERYGGVFSLVECTLESGRTHQIRVHMSWLKHPLIGDSSYGPQPTAVQAAIKRAGFENLTDISAVMGSFPRQCLHAYALSFVHPVTQETISFEQETPEDMRKLLILLDQ